MKYTVVDKDNIFIQEGKGHSKYALIRSTGQQFIINATCDFIINAAFENDNTETLLELLKEKYSKVPADTLEKDLAGIMNMLAIFNIIKTEGQEAENTQEMDVLGEDEYREASKMMIAQFHKHKLNIGMAPDFYTPVNIRAQIMNNNEYYFRYRADDGKIKAIMAVVPNLKTSVVTVNAFVCDKSVSEAQAVDLFKDMLELVEKNMQNKINKMRMVVYEDNKGKYPNIVELLKQVGFELEAKLEKEIGNKSVCFWTLFK